MAILSFRLLKRQNEAPARTTGTLRLLQRCNHLFCFCFFILMSASGLAPSSTKSTFLTLRFFSFVATPSSSFHYFYNANRASRRMPCWLPIFCYYQPKRRTSRQIPSRHLKTARQYGILFKRKQPPTKWPASLVISLPNPARLQGRLYLFPPVRPIYVGKQCDKKRPAQKQQV